MVLTVTLGQGGDVGSLETVDMPAEPLGPGGVRVRIRAVSLNSRDLLVIGGKARAAGGPTIPFSDAAGEVAETAADVVAVAPDMRVALTFNPDWIGGPWRPSPRAGGRGGMVPGVMRAEMVVHWSELVRLPDAFDCDDGATLPCAATTAWNALCGARPLVPGMSVLVQGGGGVSIFAPFGKIVVRLP